MIRFQADSLLRRPMHIERIQVEDGFLDGLDLEFMPGLNTLIGARGTGKTSIIELIRYCFGVEGSTQESGRKSSEHALSILGDGQITLTIQHGNQSVEISRSARSSAMKGASGFLKPIIFSQTEIETVGLQPGGRLNLIDAFDVTQSDELESHVEAEVWTLTSQASSFRLEVDELHATQAELPELRKELEGIKLAEAKLGEVSAVASQKSTALMTLTDQLSQISIGDSATDRFQQHVASLRSAIEAPLRSRSGLEPWPPNAGLDTVSEERKEFSTILKTLKQQVELLITLEAKAGAAVQSLSNRRAPLESQSRMLRKEIEQLQAGAGEVSRQGQQVRGRIAQIESLKELERQKRVQMAEIMKARNAKLDELGNIREARFHSRQVIVRKLNNDLGPRIRIAIEHAGQTQTYSSLIAVALKGSGIRYNELAPLIARALSPRELMEIVENSDLELLTNATSIGKDRALRLIAALRDCDLGRLATIALDDSVTLSLLDGKDYKDIEDLSTGQRCTVVLPILLKHADRILVVDQPEDHIDNAFIAETLIRAVIERPEDGQIIFSTHNANIPVLGFADFVVQMGSDGHRGFPLVKGSLTSSSVVTAISTVMEGGADAFARRAAFYKDNYA